MADHAVQVYYCLSEDSVISPEDKSLVRLFKRRRSSHCGNRYKQDEYVEDVIEHSV